MVQLTQTNGTITKNYDYDAFGIEKDIDQNDTNPFRYCGEYYDTETGTIYLRARYYDPSVGRFISEDPIGDGLNWYTYAGNNPIMFIDPSGFIYDEIDYLRGLDAGLDDAFFGGNIRKVANVIFIVSGNSDKVIKDTDIQKYVDYNQEYCDGYYTGQVWGIAPTAATAMGGLTNTGGTGPAVVTNSGGIVSGSSSGSKVLVVPNIYFSENDEDEGTNQPDIKYPGDDPAVSPGEGWEWRGAGDPSSGKGSWYNPETGESLHPDLQHPDPIGSHWDYKAPDGNQFRINPDGTIIPK